MSGKDPAHHQTQMQGVCGSGNATQQSKMNYLTTVEKWILLCASFQFFIVILKSLFTRENENVNMQIIVGNL
jgi:hypothetical protein